MRRSTALLRRLTPLPLLALAACALTDRDAEAPRPDRQPNILLFLVDDLGWQDLSVALASERTGFNDRYRTPAVERMARQGLRFTQAYTASPVCTPTRTSILRGQHPARTRITDWTLHIDRDFSRGMPELGDAPWRREGLAPGPELLTERLRAAGYRTIHVGKAHFGAIGTPGADPFQMGFDRNVAGHAAGGPGSYLGTENYGNGKPGPWGVPGLEAYHGTETFLTHALTLEAEKELELAARDGRPFFMNMAHYAVHAPIHKDERFYQQYRDAGLDDAEARYAGLIAGYDDSLGRLWAKLEALDLADDTLIVFYSDNGGLTAHARGAAPDGGTKDVHNAPLRSGKGSGYEGGIRVPMLVCWAGDEDHGLPVPVGETVDAPVLSTDLYVTLLQLAGIDEATIAAGEPDGQSFLPLLAGATELEQRRPLAWHYPHKWGPRGDRYEPFTAYREGRWKIVYWYESRVWELYDLETDLGEAHDRMQDAPQVAARMQEAMRAWMRTTDAQRPTDKATGEMLPVP